MAVHGQQRAGSTAASLSPRVSLKGLSGASAPHSADTFTAFWWAGPAGMWASPSGVVTGGVGMLMMAVVMWLLRQFREADSLRLERLQGETDLII
ncbi:hypothetical protein EYF80_054182 [Liparis tanakae]|uniref:Uncharacterized protein n=1 Tax=Liparis tanakae TaxID=230148 RepID=A0A4Z2F3D1_9TELE|nr:hypothetical protein EYF80_054182 [Liparis tanakae]